MTGRVALAVAWTAVVVIARTRRGPAPARVRALATASRGPARQAGRHARLFGLGVLSVGLGLVAPPAALLVPVGAMAWPRLRARRQVRHRAEALAADLPEVVDLLRMCVSGGLNVTLAVQAVGRRADGPVARALASAVAATGRGLRLADALDELPARLGEPIRPLVAVLVGCERYGHPIGPALERLAGECRADQRRRAEAAARRVPVLLLFPLVTCILPAFALLTVAPLVAGALRALRV
jgi:tight adherence protein C